MPVPVSLHREHHERAARRQTVVADAGDADPAHVGGRDRERAALRHGVPGVDGQVRDHLLELAGIRGHVAERGIEIEPEQDPLAHEPPQHAAHVAHDRVEVDLSRLHDLLAAEREELTDERRRPVGRAADLLDVVTARVDRGGVREQQLGAAEDGGEQVVEVVGDSARELADRLHLLGESELVLQALSLRNVAQVHQQILRLAIGVLHDRRVHVHPQRSAAGLTPAHLQVQCAGLTPEEPLPLGELAGDVVGVQHGRDRRSDELRLLEPEQAAERRGDLHPAAVHPEMRRHHERERLRARELRPALAKLVLDPEAFDRAAAMVRELLQHGQVVLVVGLRRVALDGEDAGDAVGVMQRHEHEGPRPAGGVAEGYQFRGLLAGLGPEDQERALAEHPGEHRGRKGGGIRGWHVHGRAVERVHREHVLDPIGFGEIEVEGARVPPEQLLGDRHDDPGRFLGGAGGAQPPADLEEGGGLSLRARYGFPGTRHRTSCLRVRLPPAPPCGAGGP